MKRESALGRKERRNLKQRHADLMKCGYRGSYDRVAAFARVWGRQQQEASKVGRDTFVALVFTPGEAFQFDWSEDWLVIGTERPKRVVSGSKLTHAVVRNGLVALKNVRGYPWPVLASADTVAT